MFVGMIVEVAMAKSYEVHLGLWIRMGPKGMVGGGAFNVPVIFCP